MQTLKPIIESLKIQAPSKTILVLGDIMIDSYLIGTVSRVSPEAPVPVVQVTESKSTAGGAANVAKNLSALSTCCAVSGRVGSDSDGLSLLNLLSEFSNPSDNHVVVSATVPTTKKTRIIGNGQQICRIDKEGLDPLNPDQEQEIFDYFLNVLPRLNAVIISDYGKGVITPVLCKMIIERCRAVNVPVMVDPFPKHFKYYKGVTAMTPNVPEASACAPNDYLLDSVARRILTDIESDFLLITRGKDGLSLYSWPGKDEHFPAVAKQVYDVTGAGDTVIAVFTLAMICGVSLPDCCRLANLAAGLVVAKQGAGVVTLDELLEAVV